MEFPNLGEHCHEKSCNRLDFLPMKCDACSYIFCKDHIHYANHTCEKAYQKDVQVPVCPLCNHPVPSKRSEPPDIAVGQHIDNDCMSDPAVNKRKVYTNRCSVKGCKQKELVPIKCNLCAKNYCLKHRHQSDHKCDPVRADRNTLTPAAMAAIERAQNMKTTVENKVSGMFSKLSTRPQSNGPSTSSFSNYQRGMTEDEAMALAMQKSLSETNSGRTVSRDVQEQEDRLLAEAIAASEGHTVRHQKEKTCCVS